MEYDGSGETEIRRQGHYVYGEECGPRAQPDHASNDHIRRKIGHGGDDIRRCDEPGRALEDIRLDEIGEADSGGPMTEEDDLKPDQLEFITSDLALFEELHGVSRCID